MSTVDSAWLMSENTPLVLSAESKLILSCNVHSTSCIARNNRSKSFLVILCITQAMLLIYALYMLSIRYNSLNPA